MKKSDSNLDSFYQDLAGRFRALSRLFGQFGSQEAVQQMLENLISGDAEAFAKLIDPVDIPNFTKLGKCFVIQEIIKNAILEPTTVEFWILRDDLTLDEVILYLSISRRYPRVEAPSDVERFSWLLGGYRKIPPGPFLDELIANGLVKRITEVQYDWVETWVLGKPERVCV